jgi:hypothetical protein
VCSRPVNDGLSTVDRRLPLFRHLGEDADVQLAVQKVAGRLGGSVNALANEEDVAYSGHQSRSQFSGARGAVQGTGGWMQMSTSSLQLPACSPP